MIKSLTLAVGVTLVGVTVVSSAREAVDGSTAARTGADEFASPPISSLLTRVKPNLPSAENREAEAKLFADMSNAQATLPSYTRTYTVPVVDENQNAAPPGRLITYSHRVIGTDPRLGGITSIIPVDIVPIVITAPNGITYNPTTEILPGQGLSVIDLDRVSPLFNSQQMTLGGITTNTQLLDAWVRGERWQYVQSLPNYHLLLAPTVFPTLALHPTSAQFQDVSNQPLPDGSGTYGSRFGRVLVFDLAWLTQQIQSYIASHPAITPATIPVFVTSYNIVAQIPGGYFGGYHNSVGTQTYIWHTDVVQRSPPPGSPVPAQLLEHELAELIDHPFPAIDPDQPTCADEGYEAADPEQFGQADFIVNNANGRPFQFQDLAYAGWTEGEYPSTALQGRYTIQGKFRFPCF